MSKPSSQTGFPSGGSQVMAVIRKVGGITASGPSKARFVDWTARANSRTLPRSIGISNMCPPKLSE